MKVKQNDGLNWLPDFEYVKSGGCSNPNCEASGRYVRVLSIKELERTYQKSSAIPLDEIPPQASHICDFCGWVYSGYDLDSIGRAYPDRTSAPDIEVPFEYDNTVSVRENMVRYETNLPDDIEGSEAVKLMARDVNGVSEDMAKSVLSKLGWEVVFKPIDEYM